VSASKKIIIEYICSFCGKKNKKFFRKDLSYKFCNRSCNGKSRIDLLNSRDRRYEKNPSWKGGRRKSSGGYIQIYSPNHPTTIGKRNKLVFEHRLVLEKYLGRFLEREEVVHHINHDKSDNRLDNLKLFKNHSEHMIFEQSTRIQ